MNKHNNNQKVNLEHANPVHPSVLLGRFLTKNGISMYFLAKRTGISADVISRLVRGKRAFTADTAYRIGKVLCIPERKNLLLSQAFWEFSEVAKQTDKYSKLTPITMSELTAQKKTIRRKPNYVNISKFS